MNVSELLPFVPGVLFAAVSAFIAWRISRTGTTIVKTTDEEIIRSDAQVKPLPVEPMLSTEEKPDKFAAWKARNGIFEEKVHFFQPEVEASVVEGFSIDVEPRIYESVHFIIHEKPYVFTNIRELGKGKVAQRTFLHGLNVEPEVKIQLPN